MTEAEWMTCTNPQKMLDFLGEKANDRKLRLFAVACCRGVWAWIKLKRSREATEQAERYADGLLNKATLAAAADATAKAWIKYNHHLDEEDHGIIRSLRAVHFACCEREALLRVSAMVMNAHRRTTAEIDLVSSREAQDVVDAEGRRHVLLLRDIFDNPFHPARIEPVLLPHSVVSFAQATYEQRALPSGELDPERLAILADAVEEAGCKNTDILMHCRQTGPHVRGCWVLDLLLGKS
jgi:hypothetical protein